MFCDLAVAAAAILTLSAKDNVSVGSMNSANLSAFTAVANFKFEPAYLFTTTPTNLFTIPTTPGAGELERRLLFSYIDTGNNGGTPAQNTRVITAWLLNADPSSAPTKARYLATFTELR